MNIKDINKDINKDMNKDIEQDKHLILSYIKDEKIKNRIYKKYDKYNSFASFILFRYLLS